MVQCHALKCSPLFWSSVPEDNFSDWTIEVMSVTDNGTLLCTFFFYVHKSILGSDAVKSEYFKQLLAAKEHQSIVKIRLQVSTAAVFPQVLDYIYTNKWMNSFDVHLVDVGVLAEYLKINQLWDEVVKRINRLGPDAVYELLPEAHHLKSQALVEIILNILKKHGLHFFKDITSKQLLSINSKAINIIFALIYKSGHGFVDSSESFSIAMSAYLDGWPDLASDWKLLAPLTNAYTMPRISPYAAFFLLGLTSKADASNEAAHSLEQRCLKVCETWQKHSCLKSVFLSTSIGNESDAEKIVPIQPDDFCMADYCNLPDYLKVKVLQSSLKGCLNYEIKALKERRNYVPKLGFITLKPRNVMGKNEPFSKEFCKAA